MALGKNRELVHAASEGDLDQVVEYARFWGDPKFNDSEALKIAAERGHTDVVAYLIPLSNPNAQRGWALKIAALNGHVECVKLLIKSTNLSASWSDMPLGQTALFLACKKNHTAVVDCLFEHVDADAVLHKLQQHPDTDTSWTYLEHKITARQRSILDGAVGNHGEAKTRKI